MGLESDYPYEASQKTCRIKEDKKRFKIEDYHHTTPRNNISSVVKQLDTMVVTASVEVRRDFQSYKSGIYESTFSCGRRINHAIALVGYNTTGGIPYLILRNSWAESWGMKGYMNVAIGSGSGTCGLGLRAVVPDL